MVPIAHRLKVARSRRGWSLEQLASEASRNGAEVSVGSLSYYEQGRVMPGLGRALALADALGVTLHWLVGREPLERYGRLA